MRKLKSVVLAIIAVAHTFPMLRGMSSSTEDDIAILLWEIVKFAFASVN
jgi:hypothetical protein